MRRVIAIVVIIIVLLTIFFIKINYKNQTFGNNKNKSADKIKKYILGITSYEIKESITIVSNNNTNNYEINEKYSKGDNLSSIEIIKPEILGKTKIKYDGKDLKIENNKIEVKYIYENYKYIGENDLTLAKFIEDYSNCKEIEALEEENYFVIRIKNGNGNKINSYKKLYLNKNDLKPCKLEINDITQNINVYILYNEIKVNNLQDDDILAFKLKITNDDI